MMQLALELSLGASVSVAPAGASALFASAPVAALADTSVLPLIGTPSYPSGVYVAALGKSFLTWEHVNVRERSVARIVGFDHSAATPDAAWSTIYDAGAWFFEDDAHGQPVIERGPDEHFYCFFGAHNTNIQWAISVAANDIGAWNKQSALVGSYTYPKPCVVGSDIHLLARKLIASSPIRAILIHRSGTPSSGSLTFGAETQLVDFGSDSRVYVSEVHVVGTELHFVATKADGADTARKGVYYFRYQTTTGNMFNFAGTTTINNADLPVDLTEANADFRLVDSGSNRTFMPSLQFDVNGGPHILYGDGTGTSIPAKHIWHDGTAWQSAAAVATIQDGDAGTGFVDICCLVPAAAGAMEAWYPQDPGSDWSVRGGDMTRKIWTPGGGWGAADISVVAGPYAYMHPFAVRNAAADMRVVWHEGLQSLDYAGAVALGFLAHGDSGFALPASSPVFQYGVGADAFHLQVDAASVINDVTWRYNDQFAVTGATVVGSEMVFDGNDRINWPDSGAWVLSGDFTMVFAAVKWSSLTETVQQLLSKQNGNVSAERSFAALWTSSAGLQFNANVGSGYVGIIAHAFTPTINQSYDIVFERKGSTLRLYIDDLTAGNEVASATMSGSTINVTHNLVFGAEYNTGVGGNYRRFFSGRLTKCRLVHVAEIAA